MREYDVFHEEVMKSAVAGRVLTRAARLLTESPLRTALVGAGVGAAGNAVAGGDAGDVIRGGLQGAALGGAAGGAGRFYRDTRLLNPTLSATQAIGKSVSRLGEEAANFGRRQIHGATGAYGHRASEIGMRSSGTAKKEIDLLNLRREDLRLHNELTPRAAKKLDEAVTSARDTGVSGDMALRAGITNLPGIVRGVANAPISTAKAMGRDLVGGGGVAGLGMAVGMPIALSAPDLARGDESRRGGRSMREKLVGLGSNLAGGALTTAVPVVPQLASGILLDSAASRALGKSKQRLGAESQRASNEMITSAIGGV